MRLHQSRPQYRPPLCLGLLLQLDGLRSLLRLIRSELLRILSRHLDRSVRLARQVEPVVYCRHSEAGEAEESARKGMEGRLVGKELVNVMERDRRRSAAGVGRVGRAAVEDMESAKEEARRSLDVEEEVSSSSAEEGTGLEAGCSWVEEDIGAVEVDCSFDAVDSLLDDHLHLHRNNLSWTYCLCLL